jgi:catechol 2,3-dioxygenase-like lactoylglutathione lyase family enzyme
MRVRLDHVQIAMPAGGEEQARRFFGGVLGLSEIPKPTELSGRGGCWFELGDRQLHLGVDPDFRPARKAHIAVIVDDFDGLRASLAAAGHTLREDVPLKGHERFFSDDPFGNRIEFIAASAGGGTG